MADTRKVGVAAALHADADPSVRTVRTGGDSFGLPVLAGERTIVRDDDVGGGLT
jgi:hypothetical protein